MKLHIIHKFNKWEQYDAPMVYYGTIFHKLEKPISYTESRQRRTCRECGKMEDVIV